MKAFYKINKCRICNNSNLKTVIDLKKQYIQGSFKKKNKPIPYLRKIPMKLVLCSNCSLLQMAHTTRKEILYKNYWYESGINLTMRTHLKLLVKSAIKIIKKKKQVNVLDIGCNDGTLLNFYPKKFKKYGIDPSQIINKIDQKKITVIQDYFPPDKKINKYINKKFDIITSIAMFYDLDNPNLFVSGIKKHLKKNGIWIFELSYLIDMLKLNSFDTICHEHLEYYSIHSLDYLMKIHKMKIFHVSKNSINGGSIRCFVTHVENNSYHSSRSINYYKKLLFDEKKMQIKKDTIYKKFFSNILIIKKNLINIIKKVKSKNEKIYILGASTKGNTILQFININKKIIPIAIERNKEKIGAKIIGSNIDIVGEKFVKKNQPKYKLVLPWHFKNEIVKRELYYILEGGNLIFPLPRVSIINKKNYKKYVENN